MWMSYSLSYYIFMQITSVMDDERSERLFIPESNTQEIVQNFSNEWDLGESHC